MISCRWIVVAATVVGAAVQAGSATAQIADIGDTEAADKHSAQKAWRYTVGFGPAVVPDYVGSDDYTVGLAPKLRAEKAAYFVDVTGPLITSNVLPTQTWQLGPAAQYIKGGRCNSNDNVVNDMNCQADAFMLGGMGGYNYSLSDVSRLSAKLRMMFDITQANEGYTVEPLVEYGHRISNSWGLLLQGNLLVGSENYQDYYFGVSGPQSRQSGLREYGADGGVQQFGFTAVGSYDATDRIRLDLVGRYQRLVSDAEDSPLVDGQNGRGDPNQFIFGLIASYSFGL
jgi:outer membrane protein